jgi:hypothetical protein
MCIWWKSRFSKTVGNLDRTNTRDLSRIVAVVENSVSTSADSIAEALLQLKCDLTKLEAPLSTCLN